MHRSADAGWRWHFRPALRDGLRHWPGVAGSLDVTAMSYNTHKRFALDATKPLPHRASHARSCTVHVASQLHVPRGEIIERVKSLTGVDLMTVSTDESLHRALACLDGLRLPQAKLHDT